MGIYHTTTLHDASLQSALVRYLYAPYIGAMPSKILTEPWIRNLKPESDKQVDHFDKKVTGLGIRVSPRGTKTFFFHYRYHGGNKRLTLGRYGEISLSMARSKARECKQLLLLHGQDPSLERKRLQRAPQHDFAALIDDYIANYAKRKTKSWKETERLLKHDFGRAWGRRDITQIQKRDVTQIIDAIAEDYPSAANHALAHLRKMFNWAVERDYIARTPCAGLKLPTRPRSRDRVLDHQELWAVWNAATDTEYPYGRLIQLLLLTAQRRTEVAAMEWSELDLDGKIWTIPTQRTKGNRPNVVPLSPPALRIISSLPRLHDKLVFPARGSDNAVSGFSKWKRALDRRAGVTEWVVHDLRRTVTTGFAALGVPPHVVALILNHRTGSMTQIARVYNRHEYMNERRLALDRWAEKLMSVVAQKADPSGAH